MKHGFPKIPLLGSFAVRPRLALAILLGVAFYFILPAKGIVTSPMILAWDFGTGFYMVAAAVMMARANEAHMRKNAALQDENGGVILALTIIGAAVSLSAIMQDLATAKNLTTHHAEMGAILLAAATVVLTWMFVQIIFALHYAHAYYSPVTGRPDRGLEFPGKYTTPDYWDFVYFSIVIGAAAATADINITSREIRRVATLQSIIAFFFNAAVLALAINIGASLV